MFNLQKNVVMEKNLPHSLTLTSAATPHERLIQALELLPSPINVGIGPECNQEGGVQGNSILLPEQIYIGVKFKSVDDDVEKYIAIYNIDDFGWVIIHSLEGYPEHTVLYTRQPYFRDYMSNVSSTRIQKYNSSKVTEESLRTLLSKNIILDVVYNRSTNLSVIQNDRKIVLFSCKQGDTWFQKQSNSIKSIKNRRNKIINAAKKEKKLVQLTSLQALNKSNLPNNLKRNIVKRAKINMT